MKKHLLTCALVCQLAATGTASAQVVSPYLVDFNTAIDVSAHDFKVDKGWGHIVDSSSGSYVNYQYNATEGIDGTGCLFVPTQSVGGWWSTTDVCDLLVTPKLTGAASIMVKTSAPAGEIAFYEVTRNADGTYKRGSKISADIPELDQYDFKEVTLPTTSNGYVGIYAKFAYLDDFKAEQAEIVLAKSLALKNLERLNQDVVYCDADGFFTLHYTVQVQNTGEVDFQPGDEGFSVSIYNKTKEKTVYTLPITQALAVGETSEVIDIEGRISYAENPDNDQYMVREDVSGNTLHGNWLTVRPYAPVMNVCTAYSDVAIAETDVQNWGAIQQPTSKSYRIRNIGPAPLELTGISLPDGFTTTLSLPATVEGNGEEAFEITLGTETLGVMQGDLTLFTNAGNFKMSLKGTVIDPSVWYVDFEDNAMPGNMVVGNNWAVKMHSTLLGLTENTYRAESSSASLSKLVSPKLKVTEGAQLSFMAGKQDDNSVLNVYYSADRNNWQLAKAISARAASEEDLFNNEKVSSGSGYYATSYYLPKTFSVGNIPAGEWYIAFESGKAWVDDIQGYELVEVDHDLMVSASSVPAEGMVNKEMTATATIKNLNTKSEAANTYTAKLYFDDEVVGTADPVEMKGGQETAFTFTFAPHKAGSYQAHMEFEGDGFLLKTADSAVAVSEEAADNEIQVGDARQAEYKASPLSSYYNNSGSEVLYTAELLAERGLAKGAKVKSITFKGYSTTKTMLTKVSAWIENTEDESFATPFAAHATDGMTQIMAGEDKEWPIVGSAYTHEPLLTLTLSEPFVYDGNGIRLTIQSEKSENATAQQAWGYLYFEQDNSITNLCYTRASDASLESGTWSAQPLPVAYFEIETEPATLSGTVTDETNAPIEGANVTLTCGNVEYAATSDAEGNYTVNVLQTDKAYTLTATADGFVPYESDEPVSLAEGNVTKDIIMTAEKITVSVSAYGWASFSSDKAVDISQTEGLNAYVVTSYTDRSVHLEEVAVVPAHTGVLLQGEEGVYELHETAEGQDIDTNLLVATDETELTVTADDYGHVYAFGVMNEEVGFVKASTDYIVGRHKAYLRVSEALAAPFFSLGIDDVATGISSAGATATRASQGAYDLQGRQINASSSRANGSLARGIYIMNGKKVIIGTK